MPDGTLSPGIPPVGVAASRRTGEPCAAPPVTAAVCTLAEGHYFCGVAALVNSLVRGGFAGEVVIGYRGPLPGWVAGLPPDATGALRLVTAEVSLRLIETRGAWHLANLKARFLHDLLVTHCPDVDAVFYFDPDIVVTRDWSILAGWTQHGVVMVLDVYNDAMPPDHVYRRAWERLAHRRGYATRPATGYVNSGCVGLSRADLPFVAIWADLMEGLAEDGFDMTKIKYHGDPPEFTSMDQDVLNATIMASDSTLALLGSDAMGAYPRLSMVPHAMFEKKPWVRRYVFDALRGIPPGGTHRAFWRYVDGPIRPFDRVTLARKRLGLAIARIISLFHVRNPRDL